MSHSDLSSAGESAPTERHTTYIPLHVEDANGVCRAGDYLALRDVRSVNHDNAELWQGS
jgi:hypothetical protein